MKVVVRLLIFAAVIFGTQEAKAQAYCEYLFGFAWCDASWSVDDITIGTFSAQNTGCGTGGPYTNNTATTISVTKGSPTAFTLGSGSAAVMWGIWIDLNHDGDFTDATDFFWGSNSASTTVSGSFVVPAGTVPANTRIRIASRDQSLAIVKANACDFGFQAETEDYNLLMNAPGGCNTPTNLAAATFPTSAFLTWDSVGTAYNVQYGVQGFTLGTGDSVSTTTDTVTITGLTQNTFYHYYVRTDCSSSAAGKSSWNGPFTFRTQCTPFAVFPFTEDFDSSPWVGNTNYDYTSDTISGCWDRFPLYTWNYAWLVRTGSTPSSPNTGPSSAFGGTGNYMYVEDNGTAGDEAFFTSPQFNTSGLTAPWLTFQYHMFGSNIGTLYLEVSTNGGQNWSAIDSLAGQQHLATTSSWLERGIDVTAYKGANFMFRFKALHGPNYSYGDIAIDHITLGEVPSCKKPSSVTLNNITGSSVQINWSNTSATYYIEIGPTGFTQGTGSIDTVSNTGTHSFSNLAGNTFYDIYIKTDCSSSGNGLSAWAGPYSFRTILRPTWEENFNVDGFVPNLRWLKAIGVLANPTVFTNTNSGWYEDGWLNNGYNGAIRNTFPTWNSVYYDWFFTEQIDLGTGNSWEFYFDMAATIAGAAGAATLDSDDTVKVVISTDGGLTWNKSNTLFTISQATNLSNTGATFTIDLSGYSGIVKIGFYMENTITNLTGVDIFVDNMGIRVPAACPAPTALNATNITASSLNLSWTGNSSSNSYNIEYGPKGFAQGTGTVINGISTTNSAITGLNPVTQYDFYVTSICTSDTSVAAGPFTALTGCPAVFATPYFTNFDVLSSGNPPSTGKWDNCWVSNNAIGYKYRWNAGKGVGTWATSGPIADHTTGVADQGIYMIADGSTVGIDATLTNGPFDLSTLTTPTLGFWYFMYGADMGELRVDVSKDQVTWQKDVYVLKGEKQASSAAAWLEAQVPLSQYLGDSIYIRFRSIRGTGNNSDIAIDDISIDNKMGCVPPGGLTVIDKTPTSATLSWGSYSTPQTLEWGPAGFAQGTGAGTIVQGITGTSFVLTGLTPNTGYAYFVKDTCNPGLWVGPYTFYTECNGPLTGTYTVGGTPGANNFATLKDAFKSLENCGISSAVTINLTGGDNGKNLSLGSVPGANASSIVTINGSGTDTIYGAGKNFALELNGASYVRMSNIYFDNRGGIQVIWMHNNTNHVTIDSCDVLGRIYGNALNSTANIAGTLLPNNSTGDGLNTHHITISNNTISGGYTGISFFGDGVVHTKGYVITNNTIKNTETYGIRMESTDSVIIDGNYMKGTKNQYSGYGALLNDGNGFVISNNYFAAKTYGLTMYNQNKTGSITSYIVNNMLVGTNTGTGLDISNSSHINVYFNSVSGGYNGFNLSTYSSGDYYNFRNNIFRANTGFAFNNNSTTGSNFVMDYNLYYAAGTSFVTENGTSYADLASWKTGKPAFNVHSLQGDPQFATVDDLHIIGTLPNDVGVAIPGITTDFDGDVRPAAGSTMVDMGADEFTPKLHDIAVTQLVDPKSGCGDSLTTVTLRIRNLGTATVTSVPLHVEVTGGMTATINYTYTGSIASLASVNVLVGTVNSYNGGNNLTVKAYASLALDEDAANDTLITDNMFFIPAKPAFETPDSVCFDATATTTLKASNYSGVNYAWFANATDTVPYATTDSIVVPISAQPTWYLSYGPDVQDSLEVFGFVSQFGGAGGVMFNLTAKANVVIDSFDLNSRVNTGDTSMLIVHYIPYGTYVGNETNPNAWTIHDTVTIVGMGTLNKTKAVLNTPLSIPTGAVYAIYLEYNAAFDYTPLASTPINTPLLTFQGGIGLWNPFSGIASNNLFDGIIHSHSVACSDVKVPVDLNINLDTAMASFITTVSQPNKVDVDASASQGHIISWTFGDGGTATGIIANHTYTTGGPYTITCIVEDTVCNTIDTTTFAVNMTIGVTENELTRSINIFPNPSAGIFNLTFDVNSNEDVSIVVIDALGRTISTESFSNGSGTITRQLDLKSQARGLYFVHITAGENTVVKKITKM